MIHQFTFLEKILLNNNIIPHPLIDALSNVLAGRALQVSIKLGLLEQLGKEDLTIEELAKKTKTSSEGVEVLVDNLEALGYVTRERDKLSLSKRGKKFFSSKESSMVNTILFSNYVFEALGNLEKNIKQGRPKDINLDIFSKEQWEIFNKTMLEVSSSNAKEVANLLPRSEKFKSLLDIGGSHGLYAIEYVKKLPGMKAVVFDLQPVEEFANKVIREQKMSKMVKFKTGDFFKDQLGSDYDVVFAFNIIHGLNEKQNRNLIKKVFESLNPGGMFVLLDQIKEASGNSHLSKLVSAAQGLMLFNQAGGKTYTFNEVETILKSLGFSGIKMKKLRAPGNALIYGFK